MLVVAVMHFSFHYDHFIHFMNLSMHLWSHAINCFNFHFNLYNKNLKDAVSYEGSQ